MKPAPACNTKQPMRPHFIRDWMEALELRQADVADGIGANKTNVSNWVKGQSPGSEWQKLLAEFFGTTPAGLFRHPNEDRVASFFASLSQVEIERAISALKAAFPEKENLLNQKTPKLSTIRNRQGTKRPDVSSGAETFPPGEDAIGRSYTQVVLGNTGSTGERSGIRGAVPRAAKDRKRAK